MSNVLILNGHHQGECRFCYFYSLHLVYDDQDPFYADHVDCSFRGA